MTAVLVAKYVDKFRFHRHIWRPRSAEKGCSYSFNLIGFQRSTGSPVVTGYRNQRWAETARAALTELNASGRLIPNQSVLINSIPLIEAQASSEIENFVTTTDRLFRFANEASNSPDSATKEVLRYSRELAEVIFVNPYRRIGDVVSADIAKRQAARRSTLRLLSMTAF